MNFNRSKRVCWNMDKFKNFE